MYENFSAAPERARAFFARYADRIIYGTDIGGRCVLMGEDKAFDEAENLRRPEIVRAFLTLTGEEEVASDGHFLIKRPPFTMRGPGLSDAALSAVLGGNFARLAGEDEKRRRRRGAGRVRASAPPPRGNGCKIPGFHPGSLRRGVRREHFCEKLNKNMRFLLQFRHAGVKIQFCVEN